MGTLADSLFTVLMSWVRALVNGLWALFSADRTTTLEFLGKHWLLIAVAASFVIMSLGISGGIERACKVMMPVLLVLFLLLGVYIAFLPGAADGYKYIFTLNPKGLLNP